MAVAVRLQNAGFQTTIFESRDRPGGRAYVYEQDGFIFDGGPTVEAYIDDVRGVRLSRRCRVEVKAGTLEATPRPRWLAATTSMTGFRAGGPRTASPEDLGALQKVRTLITGVSIPRPESERTPADLGLPFEVHRFPGSGGHELEAWHLPGPADVCGS